MAAELVPPGAHKKFRRRSLACNSGLFKMAFASMEIFSFRTNMLFPISCMLLLFSIPVIGEDYDPLITPSGVSKKVTDMTIHDSDRARQMLRTSGPGGAKEAFDNVSIPWMLMTGTKDTAPFGNNSEAKSRLAVFAALPHGGKYELVLFDAEHSAFTDQTSNRRSAPRNPNHHRAILALSTAFWDTDPGADIAAQDCA